MEIAVELPPAYKPLFTAEARYRVAYGGRASAKSWTFARRLLIRSLESRCRILCAREFQVSLADSVHKLLADQVELLHLNGAFTVQNSGIYAYNGSEFIFSGIRNNITKIRSTEGIDICWVEEAEKVSAESWEVLIPTIRKPASEIWVTFNPDQESDPTYQRFIASRPPQTVVVKTSWRDNPHFPAVLGAERDYLASVDPGAYAHVWEGECRQNSSAQVLTGKYRIESFEPQGWDGPYYGADWGFAQDPTVLVKCWVHESRLYVEYEAYGVGVDIDRTPELFRRIPDCNQYMIRGDSARPETISFLQRHGFPNIAAVEKWPGSVEDGVAFLRSFEAIIIHPRCVHTQDEARLWSYKTDRLSGDPLPELLDANNHCMDAIRYALAPLIRGGNGRGIFEYYREMAASVKKPTDAPNHARL